MPFYKVRCERDGRLWPIGPIPSEAEALHSFNHLDAPNEGVGPFTFDGTSRYLPDYYLIEQMSPEGTEVHIPLYVIP